MTTVLHQVHLDLLALLNAAIVRTPAIVVATLIVVVTRVVGLWIGRWASAVGTRAVNSNSLRILLEKGAVTAVWAAGLVLAALIVFPGLRLGDIFATLGLTSVAIGFAFQDIFKNFLAGVLLLLNEPFRIGDQILVASFEGTVERIDIRFTGLRTYTGERILVPNATVFTSPVTIRTAHPQRRVDVPVSLVYGTDLERALAVLRRALDGVEGVEAEPEPRVDVVAFGESSMDFMVRFWSRPHQMDVLTAQTRVVVALDRALVAAGLETSFPTRTVLLPAPAPGPGGEARQ